MYKLVHRHVNAHVQNLSNTCRFNLFMSTYVCCYEHPSWTVLVPYIHLTLTFPTPRTLCTYPYQSITLHIHIHQIPYTCPFIKLYSLAFPSTSIYLHLSNFVYLVNPSQFIIIAINLHIPDWNLQQDLCTSQPRRRISHRILLHIHNVYDNRGHCSFQSSYLSHYRRYICPTSNFTPRSTVHAHRHTFGLLVRQPVVVHTQAHGISHLNAF